MNDQLFRAGHINQLNELRIQLFDQYLKGIVKVTNLSKQAAANFQEDLIAQRATNEAEKEKHSLTIQSLQNESNCHKATLRCLEHERATVQFLKSFLDKFEFPRGDIEIAIPERLSLGTILLEWENIMLELESTKSELEITKSAMKSLQEQIQHTTNDLSQTTTSDKRNMRSSHIAD